MVNKDFLKEVLAEEKSLFRLDQVRFIHVPLYDELSIKNLAPQMANEPEFMKYFPTNLPRGRSIDRSYFFNVMNTLNHEYTQAIVTYAEQQRHSATTSKNADQTIQISDNWMSALQSQPFISCKYFCSSNLF